MFSTQMAKSIHKRFYELRDDWKAKTRHLSNTAQISLVFCKAITPYSEPILDDVKLPLTRQEVRKRFGQPTKSRRDAVHCDEYFYEDCIVRFCYPNQKDHVAFVELARHSVAPGEPSRIQSYPVSPVRTNG